MAKFSNDKNIKAKGKLVKKPQSIKDFLPKHKKASQTSKSKPYQKSFQKNYKSIVSKNEESKGSFDQTDNITGMKRKLTSNSSNLDNTSNKQIKRDIKKKRKGSKSNFTLIEEIKESWNKLRQKTTLIDDKRKLIDELLKKLKGSLVSISLRHDASRIVQSMIQFGSIDQRRKVLAELSLQLADLSKTPYGHFTVLKAIQTCKEDDELRMIVNGLKGHFVSIGTNVIGARIVETILQTFPITNTRGLRAEFYGHKFTLLLSEQPKNLHFIIENLPTKASSLLDHMKDLIQKFIEKGLLSFAYVHQFIWEYVRELTSNQGKNPKLMEDLISTLMESVLQLVTTKPGSKSCCVLATYATAKERKRMIKTMKGHAMELAIHYASHLPLMRLIEVTDDTVNIQKSLLDEIKSVQPIEKYTAAGELIGIPYPPLITLALDTFGSKFLLRLINPLCSYLEPDELVLFSSDLTVLSSKKSFDIRWKENLTYLKSPLIQVCCKYAEVLLRSRNGWKVLDAVVKVLYPSSLITILANIFTGVPNEDIELIDDDHDEIEASTDYEDDNEEMNNSNNNINDDNVDYWKDEDENESPDQEKNLENVTGTEEDVANDDDIHGMSIHEDTVAHLLLKSLVHFDGKIINSSVEINRSLWDETTIEISNTFTGKLIQMLCGEDNKATLIDWFNHNRSALELVDAMKIPAIKELLFPALSKNETNLEMAAKDINGAKLLYDLYLSSKNETAKGKIQTKVGKKNKKL